MAVDAEELRLCWPKLPWIEPNVQFMTHIYEGGQADRFKVSLYAVDQKFIDQINEWFKSGVIGGLGVGDALKISNF